MVSVRVKHKRLEEEEASDNGGRNWRDASTSQGIPEGTKSWEGQETKSLLGPWDEAWTPLHPHFGLSASRMGAINFCCYKPPT